VGGRRRPAANSAAAANSRQSVAALTLTSRDTPAMHTHGGITRRLRTGTAAVVLLLAAVLCCCATLPSTGSAAPNHSTRCSEATAAACPSLFGDSCELCAGRHYGELVRAGCNDTSIEYSCHHVTRAAALAWLEQLSDWVVGLDIGSGTLSEANGRTCTPCSTIEDRNHIFVNGAHPRALSSTLRYSLGKLWLFGGHSSSVPRRPHYLVCAVDWSISQFH
jgi:hypothetical protein